VEGLNTPAKEKVLKNVAASFWSNYVRWAQKIQAIGNIHGLQLNDYSFITSL